MKDATGKTKQLDNSTGAQKIALRRAVLLDAPRRPVVLETHGGFGRIYERTWFKASTGVVIEKDEDKVEHLAQQRPNWRVYQGDSLRALQGGLAADMAFDVIDLDPYGSTLEYLEAFASGGRAWPDRWQLVANDGMKQKLRLGGAWSVKVLRSVVEQQGNDLYDRYLPIVRDAVRSMAARIGFRVVGWHGYHTGDDHDMTHYRAVMERAT